jgi:hypothetical protein
VLEASLWNAKNVAYPVKNTLLSRSRRQNARLGKPEPRELDMHCICLRKIENKNILEASL